MLSVIGLQLASTESVGQRRSFGWLAQRAIIECSSISFAFNLLVVVVGVAVHVCLCAMRNSRHLAMDSVLADCFFRSDESSSGIFGPPHQLQNWTKQCQIFVPLLQQRFTSYSAA